MRAIESKKKFSLSKLIYSLGIRFVGEKNALAISGAFKSVDSFKSFLQNLKVNTSEVRTLFKLLPKSMIITESKFTSPIVYFCSSFFSSYLDWGSSLSSNKFFLFSSSSKRSMSI